MERKQVFTIISLMLVTLIISACGGSDSAESESSSANEPAMVDNVTINFRENHYYAVVTGFYPDSCTRISEVRQEFNGSAINLSLSTAKPGELICAQMLTQYEVNILLEIGGLLPGEYTVDVNGISTNFTMGG
ncbi:MAG: hypothetical protein JSW42_06420 [Chloroflexota bacterium]|nr:MAG: hypothetical protein JSW42_06420 [Chloroflexota bacterium]